MFSTLQIVFERTLERMSAQLTTYLPPLLVAIVLLAATWIVALLARLLISTAMKGAGLDRFLNESGIASILGHSGRIRGSRLVAGAAYWCILIGGILLAINAFDTTITSQLVQAAVFLFPKLVTAGAILLAGIWLARYLGRSVLVWSCNQDLPCPRHWSVVSRALIVFTAAVVASDTLNFARSVFLSAFLIILGGVVLAASIALGLGAWPSVRTFFQNRAERPQEERSLWTHL